MRCRAMRQARIGVMGCAYDFFHREGRAATA